jgi:hypothetical protein
MGGTARQGTDYTLTNTSGQVVIAAGQTTAAVMLHSIADHVNEKRETAALVVNAGSGYKVPKRERAVVAIVNGP